MATGDGRKRVLVIGAGFAGLSAARTLQSKSDDYLVTVLEGGPCVGGRARKGELGSGVPVELGATWFHGVHDNPVYDLAVWQGVVKDVRGDPETAKHDIDWQLHFARPSEKQLLDGPLKEWAQEAVGRYTEAAEECTEGARHGDGSVGDVLRRTFDEAVTSEAMTQEEIQTFSSAWWFREKLQRTFDGFYSTDDVSLAFAREYETLDGPNIPVPGGYQALAELIADGLDVRCNHKVQSIHYSEDGARVVCANGAVLDADAVIVTCSLGVLQEYHQTMFHPPLPDWKLSALDGIRIGVADKIFLEFEIDPAHVPEAEAWLQQQNSSSKHSSTYHRISDTGLDSLAAGTTGTSSSAAQLVQQAGQPEPFNIGKKQRSASQAVLSSEVSWGTAAHHSSEHADLERQRRSLEESVLPSANSAPQCSSLLQGTCPPTCPLTSLSPMPSSASTGALTRLSHSAPSTSAGHPHTVTTSRFGKRRKRRTIRSYAFLWPVDEPLSFGREAALAYAFANHGISFMPRQLSAYDLPSWCYGLHSMRYSPGPEWIEPSLLDLEMDRKRAAHVLEEDVHAACGKHHQHSYISAVLWITGTKALEMEALGAEEVQKGVVQLLRTFPQVPLPPGAMWPPTVLRSTWGSDELFRGSYSYVRSNVQDGTVVDLLAEPICNSAGMPVVMFAGEATHRQYMGTVHGAFLTGCREAERLIMADQLQHQQHMQAVPMPTFAEQAGPGAFNPFAVMGPDSLGFDDLDSSAIVHDLGEMMAGGEGPSDAWDPTMTDHGMLESQELLTMAAAAMAAGQASEN